MNLLDAKYPNINYEYKGYSCTITVSDGAHFNPKTGFKINYLNYEYSRDGHRKNSGSGWLIGYPVHTIKQPFWFSKTIDYTREEYFEYIKNRLIQAIDSCVELEEQRKQNFEQYVEIAQNNK